MKTRIILFIAMVLISISAFCTSGSSPGKGSTNAYCTSGSSPGQPQIGQTCLFTCMNHLNPSRSIDSYIKAFNEFTNSHQDVINDGARATYKQTIDFIKSQFSTIPIQQIGIIRALDSGLSIMTTIHLIDDDGNQVDHEIILNSYKAKDSNNPAKTTLIFYNPATGKNQAINMLDWINSGQRYTIVIAKKDVVLENSSLKEYKRIKNLLINKNTYSC